MRIAKHYPSTEIELDRSPATPEPSVLARFLPNAITASALCAGLISVRFSIDGKFDAALAAIVAAAILDGLDGRIARKLHSTSRFGAEFDSLADFLSFGIAPILLLYFWSGEHMNTAASLCLMVFALASALRLARFNSMLEEKAPWQRAYFTGMPTPSAALAVLLPLSLTDPDPISVKAIGPYAIFIAFLMISTIPTFSGKTLKAYRNSSKICIEAAVIVSLVTFVVYPREILALATAAYLASIPLSWWQYRIKFRNDDQLTCGRE